jgi:hypothetical protein
MIAVKHEEFNRPFCEIVISFAPFRTGWKREKIVIVLFASIKIMVSQSREEAVLQVWRACSVSSGIRVDEFVEVFAYASIKGIPRIAIIP